jgi:hypothetical protein
MPPERPDRLDLDDPTGMRALLSSLPDPGPMPPDLVARITASLASEQRNRERDHTVVPLRPGHRRWRRGALIAAAAAVVAVAIPALVTGSSPGDIAALLTRQNDSGSASSAKSPEDSSGFQAGSGGSGPASTPAPTGGRAASLVAPTIYASGTAYTAASLRSQLQRLVDSPGTPVRPLASESPALGPIATPAGLQPCLTAIGVEPADRVVADLATYDGTPAVVIIVSSDTGQRGFVLGRDCATTSSPPLAGPVSLG